MDYNYELVSYFIINEKSYFILKINNKLIFVVKDLSGINLNIEDDDYILLNKVLNSLLVNENESICLGTKEYNGKILKIFYDPKKQIHFWYPANFQPEVSEKIEINTFVNFRYNYINNYVCNEKEIKAKSKNKYIKRLVNIGKKAVVVFVSAGLSITALTGCTIENAKEEEIIPIETSANPYIMFGDNLQRENDKKRAERVYDFEEIKQAIDDNGSLTDSEKDFLYKLKFIFDENHQYMDLDTIIERFRSLKISYDTQKSDRGIDGLYTINRNEITIFEASEFSYDKIKIILHEILHVMQVEDEHSNRVAVELSNEVANREFLRRMCDMGLIPNNTIFLDELGAETDFAGGYSEIVNLQYLLNELLTDEQIKHYQFYPREDIIIKALKSIDNSSSNYGSDFEVEQRAYKVLDTMDEFLLIDEEGNYNAFFEKDDYTSYYDQINYYYKILNDKSIEESMGADLYAWETYSYATIQSIDKEVAFNKTMSKLVCDRMGDRKYIFGGNRYFLPKSYFSKKYENPSLAFNSLGVNEKVSIIEIDEDAENKFINNLKLRKEERAEVNDLEK